MLTVLHCDGPQQKRKRMTGSTLRKRGKKRRGKTKEEENVWESEAQAAFKSQPVKETAWGKITRPKVAVDDDEEGWVFVEKAEDPLGLASGKTDIMIVPRDGLSGRQGKLRDPNTGKLRVTREMTDTEYNRIFKRPLPHNYGRGNTCPVSDRDYMKTFNVRAAESGSTDQVFQSALEAAKRMPDFLAKEDVALHQAPEPNLPLFQEMHATAPPDLENMTFGRPSPPRSLQPSMFEILSWDEPAKA